MTKIQDQNYSVIQLYAKLFEIRTLAYDAGSLAGYLDTPDNELIDALDSVADNVSRHLSIFKITVGEIAPPSLTPELDKINVQLPQEMQ